MSRRPSCWFCKIGSLIFLFLYSFPVLSQSRKPYDLGYKNKILNARTIIQSLSFQDSSEWEKTSQSGLFRHKTQEKILRSNPDELLSRKTSSIINKPRSSITSAITLNLTTSGASCGYGNGNMIVTASGGTPPYKYSYIYNGTYSYTQNTGNFQQLEGGSYNLTVEDANGEISTSNVIIQNTYPAPNVSVLSSTPPTSCTSFDGSMTLVASSGTPPYEYSINGVDYQTSPTFSNLSQGLYSMFVRDANGCIFGFLSINLLIVNNGNCYNRMSLSSFSNYSCNNNGSIDLGTPFGGIPPYQYSLDGINFQTSNHFDNLGGGFHSIYYKDGSGLTNIYTIYMIAACILDIPIIVVDATCGKTDGSLTASVVNGTPPYTYSIDGVNFQSSNTFNGLSAGNYTLTVKDLNGNEASNYATLFDKCPTLSLSETDESCSKNDGSITATGSSGTGPYQFSLDGINYQTGNLFNSLVAAIYTVTIKDFNGYTSSASITVKNSCIIPACPFNATIFTHGGYCIGDTIFLSAPKDLSVLQWYNDNSLVKTATSSSSSIGFTVAGGNGMGLSSNQLNGPFGIFIDAMGSIYVADRLNNRIQKFAPGSTSLTSGTTVAGGNGQGSNANQLDNPIGVFLDTQGNLFVSDNNNQRVQKFPPGSTSATNGITVAGGNGTGTAGNQFAYPWGIFVDLSGNLFVVDQQNNRVQEFPSGSTSATNGVTVAGGLNWGNGANQLANPIGIFVDGNNNMFISDNGNSRIQEWPVGAPNGKTIAGGNGSGSALNQFSAPNAIFVDGSGNVFVSDESNNRVLKFPPGSTSTTNGLIVAGGNGLGSAPNQLSAAAGVYLDVAGNIFVSDYSNNRIQEWGQQSISDTIIVPLTPGVYTANVINESNCLVSTNILTINPTVTTSINILSFPQVICADSLANFTANFSNGGQSPRFQWQVNGLDVGTNQATYSNNNLITGDRIACILYSDAVCPNKVADTSNDLIISIHPIVYPSISIYASDTNICLGSPVNFDAIALNSEINPSFQWAINGIFKGTNSASFSTSSLQKGDSINCFLFPDPTTVCLSSTKIKSNTIAIQIKDILSPTINITASANQICSGDSLLFTATIQNAGEELSYKWKWNDQDVGTNQDIFTKTNLQNGDRVYCLLQTDNQDCSVSGSYKSNTDTILVKPGIVILNMTQDTSILKYGTVPLEVSLTGSLKSFQWNPEDKLANPLTLIPVTVPLSETTSFTFTATATDGCQVNQTVMIKVLRKFKMPNAFTPNGDGKNDLFRIPVDVYLNLREFTIFNRWGNKVFTTKNKEQGWDGNFNGLPCETGTYVYMILGSDENGDINADGTFILFR